MKKFIKAVFKVIYKVIAYLNLQPILLVSLIGLVLYFTGVYDGNQVVRICLQVAFILSALYAIGATIKKLLGFEGRIKRTKGAQIVEEQGKEEPSQTQEEKQSEKVPLTETPRYFRVKQNPDYVMAEFSDRYELYLVTDCGLQKIRTDYKQNGEIQ